RRLWRRLLIVATLEGSFDRVSLAAPKDVQSLWNKGPAIWFPRRAGQAAEPDQLAAASGRTRIQKLNTANRGRCAARSDLQERAAGPARGGREVECQEAR